MSGKLDVPGNLTLVSLPAKCPELRPGLKTFGSS